MNVLVLNLTRLGDLLQSQPAIAGLAAQGHRVGLVCLDNFAPAAALMQGLTDVFPLPGARLLARVKDDWRLALAGHRQFLDTAVREFAPDAVINLTPSEPARLLAMGLAPGRVQGFALDEFGFNADTSLWAAFLQLAASSRGSSPFNIVDLFRRMSGLTGPPAGFGLRGPSEEERQAARQRLLDLVPAPPEQGFVALQLGASEDRRRWPVERFAKVAQGLSAAGHVPVLVGTASEAPLAARLKDLARVPVADLLGATDLRQLAATLCACKLLITNDTGTMHLAAGLGVPCLAIFLCTAQPWDTGPYLPGCVSLEPDQDCHPCAFGTACMRHLSCREAIAPQGVLALALDLLRGNQGAGVRVPGARVWRTVLGRDGMLDLESLSGHGEQDRTRLIELQRKLYGPYLDGEPLDGAGEAVALSAQAAQDLGQCLGDALGLLNLLRRQGEMLARDPMASMKTKFLATWQRVRSSLETQDRLALLAALWTFEAERPGLDLDGILALAARFSALLERLKSCIRIWH